MRRPLDPRTCNIACDANALDPLGDRDGLVDRFCALSSQGILTVVVGKGVREEVQNPNTPGAVKTATLPQISNLRPSLTQAQQIARFCVQSILQGDARAGKHSADASHISEAAETGCAYFITHDKRILKKKRELSEVLPPSLQIVTLAEFMDILDAYEAGWTAESDGWDG